MSFFGSNFVPPPPHINKTLEQRKEDMKNGIYSYCTPPSQRSALGKFLPIIMAIGILVFFGVSQKSNEPQKTIFLSPNFPNYSAVSVITQKSDMICHGVVIARGTAKSVKVIDENGKSKKTIFTPVLLDVITPIRGEFPKMQASYLELGGTTKSQIVEVEGITPLAVDDEVFLFYNDNGIGFGNWSVYPVIDKKVTIESDRLPKSVASSGKMTTLPLDEFTKLIESLAAQ